MAGFLLLSILAVLSTVHAAPTCTCEEKASSTQYTVQNNEVIDVDRENQIVLFHVPQHNIWSDNQIMLDYNTGLMMTLYTELNACFLSTMPDNIPAIDKLEEGLSDMVNPQTRSTILKKRKEETYQRAAPQPVRDRSMLGDQMAQMCAKFPVYNTEVAPEASIEQVSGTKTPRSWGSPARFSCHPMNFMYRCELRSPCTCINVYHCGRTDSPYEVPTAAQCNVTHDFTATAWQCVPYCPGLVEPGFIW
ncbi:uncharacterized protein LOC118432115 isoform X2 [Branchiostoma floridae]|uniref:Uncharacterized protein LOC118432115 isoform X2 n=1 Tax=Branchiostoma floridae TaxID=7739 RepID=A0A9J7MF48_BRAFL|nr:uncharacterized protein LOC118432115 isoform X2 [Branchiostoma floridae]